MAGWTVADIPDQTGKVAIVTGANTGIGYYTARALAKAGADVVLAARNVAKGEEAVAKILTAYPSARIQFSQLDLASLESISAFAARTAKTYDHVDILINNAAVGTLRDRMLTQDGFEMQVGVNFLGHFALAGQVLPLLKKAAAPRVISLSSVRHLQAKIDPNNLMSEGNYTPIGAYDISKAAMLLFSKELQRRSDRNGWNLLSVGAHPGLSRTDITKSRPGQRGSAAGVAMKIMSTLLGSLMFSTPEDGALPSLYAATSPDIKPGGYYGPTGRGEFTGPPGPAKASELSMNEELAAELWKRAEQMTGVEY